MSSSTRSGVVRATSRRTSSTPVVPRIAPTMAASNGSNADDRRTRSRRSGDIEPMISLRTYSPTMRCATRTSSAGTGSPVERWLMADRYRPAAQSSKAWLRSLARSGGIDPPMSRNSSSASSSSMTRSSRSMSVRSPAVTSRGTGNTSDRRDDSATWEPVGSSADRATMASHGSPGPIRSTSSRMMSSGSRVVDTARPSCESVVCQPAGSAPPTEPMTLPGRPVARSMAAAT